MTIPASSPTRWKVACALLAAIAGYTALFRDGASAPSTAVAPVATRSGALPDGLRRPLRVSAAAAGISKSELIDRLRSARSLKEVALLADKLALVGDDDAIDAVAPLLRDNRRGVPEAILGALGRIATPHAVDVLAAHARDERPPVRTAAVAALGATQSEAAEELLLELAQRTTYPAQEAAIGALGELASDRAVAALAKLAASGDASAAARAVGALGAANTPAATTALRGLIDSPDTRIAAAALGAISDVDDALLGKLTTVVKAGDPTLIRAALSALGKAGERALPVLREAALHGGQQTRWLAVEALGELPGELAIDTLGELLKSGDRRVGATAASALINTGGAKARALLIEVATSDRAVSATVLGHLAELEGEDIDRALLTVIQRGSSEVRRAALPRLLKQGNDEALGLAIRLASNGSRSERYDAVRALADAGTPRAFDALADVAGKARGQTRISALESMAQVRPADPALGQLLSDTLFSGRRDEATYAAHVLGRIGTEDARQSLITALGDKDPQLAEAAASALGQVGLSDSIKSALLAAADKNVSVKQQVMQQLLMQGAPEGLRLAEDLMNSKDASASQAVWALAGASTPEAKRLLDRALSSSDKAVRIAAVSTLSNEPDDQSTDTLLRLSRDSEPDVRAAALQGLGQIGSDKAQLALIEASRTGKVEERAAAISGLANLDDARASQQLATLIRDTDPQIAQLAIRSSYNAGPEVDQALSQIVNDAHATAESRAAAASQLRVRGTELDESTEKQVTALAGTREAFGGAGYGGMR